MAIWSRQCSQGWAGDEAEHQRMRLTASLTGRHRPPPSAHAQRPYDLLGGTGLHHQRMRWDPIIYWEATASRLFITWRLPSEVHIFMETGYPWTKGHYNRHFFGSCWGEGFLPRITGLGTSLVLRWPILRSQSRGPGLDLVWEWDPTCHNWVCVHDEDRTQLNK